MTISKEKPCVTTKQKDLYALVASNEEWLMARLLDYATRHNFTQYTSTLLEPWRASIRGLSGSLLASLEHYSDIPEFDAEEDWKNDPCGDFGRYEADQHRVRGIPLSMFLALMKYYRQSYIDLLREVDPNSVDTQWSELFINRVFDRIEIGFCQQWSGIDNETMIADLQKKNRDLANEKNKFLTLFESYSLPCFLIDHVGKLDCMNLAAAEVFGFGVTPGEYYYRPRQEEYSLAWLESEIAAFMLGNDDHLVFEKVYPESQEERVYVVHFKRMLDVSQKFSGVVVSLADITEKIRDKEQIEEANTRLLNAQEQISRREKLASLGRMAAGVGHEINNPLASILQSAQVMEHRMTPGVPRNQMIAGEVELDMDRMNAYLDRQSIQKLIAAIKESGSKAAAIVKQLQEHKNHLDQHAVPLDPRGVIEQAIKTLKGNLKNRRAKDLQPFDIVTDYINESLQILCDPLELCDALVSIMNNSVEAMSINNREDSISYYLEVRLDQEDNQVLIKVNDNGPGMTEEVRHKIFEPFFTTKDVGSGVGLSMSTVYRFVQKFNGTIEVDSSPGQGCRIVMKFPKFETFV